MALINATDKGNRCVYLVFDAIRGSKGSDPGWRD